MSDEATFSTADAFHRLRVSIKVPMPSSCHAVDRPRGLLSSEGASGWIPVFVPAACVNAGSTEVTGVRTRGMCACRVHDGYQCSYRRRACMPGPRARQGSRSCFGPSGAKVESDFSLIEITPWSLGQGLHLRLLLWDFRVTRPFHKKKGNTESRSRRRPDGKAGHWKEDKQKSFSRFGVTVERNLTGADPRTEHLSTSPFYLTGADPRTEHLSGTPILLDRRRRAQSQPDVCRGEYTLNNFIAQLFYRIVAREILIEVSIHV